MNERERNLKNVESLRKLFNAIYVSLFKKTSVLILTFQSLYKAKRIQWVR